MGSIIKAPFSTSLLCFSLSYQPKLSFNSIISLLHMDIEHPACTFQMFVLTIRIIGQCIYYALASTIIRKISADSVPTEDNLDQLADSVRLFSLGGIDRIKEEFLSPSKEDI